MWKQVKLMSRLWSTDLDTSTWPRCGQDAPPYHRLSICNNCFKSCGLNGQTNTHRQTLRKHYLYRIRGRWNAINNSDLVKFTFLHKVTLVSFSQIFLKFWQPMAHIERAQLHFHKIRFPPIVRKKKVNPILSHLSVAKEKVFALRHGACFIFILLVHRG